MFQPEQDNYQGQTEIFKKFADNSFSWNYIEKPAFDRHIRPLCATNPLVLEAGCGYGKIIAYLSSQGVTQEHLIGIDTNPNFVADAQRSFPRASIIHGSIAELSEASYQVDIITCNMVFEHLDQDAYAQTMRNFYSWTKPGGTLFFIEVHPERMALKAGTFQRGWKNILAPWGKTLPYYIRTMDDYLQPTQQAGYNIIASEALPIDEEGRVADAGQYAQYMTPYPPRFAVKAVKDSQESERHPPRGFRSAFGGYP